MKMKKMTMVFISMLFVCSFALAGCSDTKKQEENHGNESASAKADVPANRFKAADRTGNNATQPLVLSTGTLDGKLNPFFATSAYDTDVEGVTQLPLLATNKDGEPIAGIDVASYAYSYTQEVKNKDTDNAVSEYTFILKNGITFSDGKPVTAKDVLFSIYVLCDPLYDGPSTYYSIDIQGMEEYRTQTTKEVNEKYTALAEKIYAAGFTVGEDGAFIYGTAEGVTKEQQKEFWDLLDEAGEKFAQEIIDSVYADYPDYIGSDNFPGFTLEEVAKSETLKVAFGMAMWGYGSVDGESKRFTDKLGNTYDLSKSDTQLTAAIYWENILKDYDYDVNALNEQTAGTEIYEFLHNLYLLKVGGKEVEGGIPNISGITSGKMKCDDGVEREYVKLSVNGVDPTAIFKMAIEVAPFHYYTEGYSGTLNENGVALNTPEFMSHLKSKNNKPVGAGPYKFLSYKDNVVTYEANDNFLLGAPKIKTLRYQVISLGSELDALKTGTVHYSDPSASPEIINDITKGEGDYAKMAYTLVDNDGYGYIGIQAQAIPEWNVRKAIAHAMNVQLAVDNYYPNGLGSVNYRTMTKVNWAYPDNPENLFPYDATGETSKNLFLEAGYEYDDAANIMKYPGGHEKAGQQVTLKFTIPSDAKDHPAGSIFQNTQEVLGKIGVKVEIEVDENILDKLSTAYESGVQVWAAAWGEGGVDPDMFQIWCSDDTNQAPSNTGLHWLYKNGSDDQQQALKKLNELIAAARTTLDMEERKAIYKEALEYSTGLAVEIPTYQRKNLFAYDKNVIKTDTLLKGEDVTPFQSPIKQIWNVELN